MQRGIQILQAFYLGIEGGFRTPVPERVTQGYAEMLARDVISDYAQRIFLETVSERLAEELPRENLLLQ